MALLDRFRRQKIEEPSRVDTRNPDQVRAQDNYDLLWRMYSDRTEFIDRWKEAESFRLGLQWTEKESENLKNAGMIDYVINRTRPAYRNLKSTIMSKRPTIKLSAIRSADVDAVTEFQRLINYIWSISNGLARSQRMLDYYFDSGLGVFQIYADHEADFFRGELKIREASPEYIYLPRTSTDIQFDDANDMFYAKYISLDNAILLFGDKVDEDLIEAESTHNPELFVSGDFLGPNREKIDIELDGRGFLSNPHLVLMAEKYTKIKVPKILRRVLNLETETVDHFLTDPKDKLNELMEEKGIAAFKLQDEEEITVTRISKETSLGKQLFVDEEQLPISKFPFAFCIGEDTRNAYPVGEVHFNIGQQKMVNHLHTLIAFIGQSIGIPKMIGRKGIFTDSKHKAEVQQNYAIPSYIAEFETGGKPLNDAIQLMGAPGVPGILGELLQFNLAQIDFNTGVNPISQGLEQNVPNTAFATNALVEAGEKINRVPLLAMQICFERLFGVLAEWIPSFYTLPKVFEIVENKKVEKGSINMLDSGKFFNDITNIKATVSVDVGSHVSVSRSVAQILYKDLAGINPVFMKLFLQNIDNIDEEEKKKLIEEIDVLPKLQQQVEQLSDQNEVLQKALENSNQDLAHEMERVHLERLRGDLKTIKGISKVKAQAEIDKLTAELETKSTNGDK